MPKDLEIGVVLRHKKDSLSDQASSLAFGDFIPDGTDRRPVFFSSPDNDYMLIEDGSTQEIIKRTKDIFEFSVQGHEHDSTYYEDPSIVFIVKRDDTGNFTYSGTNTIEQLKQYMKDYGDQTEPYLLNMYTDGIAAKLIPFAHEKCVFTEFRFNGDTKDYDDIGKLVEELVNRFIKVEHTLMTNINNLFDTVMNGLQLIHLNDVNQDNKLTKFIGELLDMDAWLDEVEAWIPSIVIYKKNPKEYTLDMTTYQQDYLYKVNIVNDMNTFACPVIHTTINTSGMSPKGVRADLTHTSEGLLMGANVNNSFTNQYTDTQNVAGSWPYSTSYPRPALTWPTSTSAWTSPMYGDASNRISSATGYINMSWLNDVPREAWQANPSMNIMIQCYNFAGTLVKNVYAIWNATGSTVLNITSKEALANTYSFYASLGGEYVVRYVLTVNWGLFGMWANTKVAEYAISRNVVAGIQAWTSDHDNEREGDINRWRTYYPANANYGNLNRVLLIAKGKITTRYGITSTSKAYVNMRILNRDNPAIYITKRVEVKVWDMSNPGSGGGEGGGHGGTGGGGGTIGARGNIDYSVELTAAELKALGSLGNGTGYNQYTGTRLYFMESIDMTDVWSHARGRTTTDRWGMDITYTLNTTTTVSGQTTEYMNGRIIQSTPKAYVSSVSTLNYAGSALVNVNGTSFTSGSGSFGPYAPTSGAYFAIPFAATYHYTAWYGTMYQVWNEALTWNSSTNGGTITKNAVPASEIYYANFANQRYGIVNNVACNITFTGTKTVSVQKTNNIPNIIGPYTKDCTVLLRGGYVYTFRSESNALTFTIPSAIKIENGKIELKMINRQYYSDYMLLKNKVVLKSGTRSFSFSVEGKDYETGKVASGSSLSSLSKSIILDTPILEEAEHSRMIALKLPTNTDKYQKVNLELEIPNESIVLKDIKLVYEDWTKLEINDWYIYIKTDNGIMYIAFFKDGLDGNIVAKLVYTNESTMSLEFIDLETQEIFNCKLYKDELENSVPVVIDGKAYYVEITEEKTPLVVQDNNKIKGYLKI